MATLRELKTRIGSVASSEKITGAMKMISSAKVHKNESELKQLMPYKNQIQSIMSHLLEAGEEYNSPLIESRDVNKVGIVVFGSDDGLCGAYNINIFKGLLVEMNRLREKYGRQVSFEIYPVGAKMDKAVRKLREKDTGVVSDPDINSKMGGETVNGFAHSLRDSFLKGDLDLVEVVYMKYHSMSKQRLTVDQLFPITEEAISNATSAKSGDAGKSFVSKKRDESKMYIFEPDANSIFNTVLPMFVLSSMNEITISNRASEQAARVMAMQSANDNAKKLLDELKLEYNKLRQQSITTELLDIVGGQVKR